VQETILIVDDNRLTLDCLTSLLGNEGVRLLTAMNATEAMTLIRSEDIAVVLSDNIMPGMSGLDFLSGLQVMSPHTVKILMSAYADLPTVLAAINRSEVFRYVLKPWKDEDMLKAVRDGLSRYRLVMSMLKEDEDVLRSLAQTIELKDPSTKGHCDRVAVYALMLAEALNLPKEMLREIKYGSWLHDCGKIGVAEVLLNRDRKLTKDEFEVMKMHAFWGADVAAKANLSQVARNIIHYHHERYDGTGYPKGLRGEEIPLEARIVAVADVYDALTNDRPYRQGYATDEAIRIMMQMRGGTFDPQIATLFFSLLRSMETNLPDDPGGRKALGG
jgi:putative two-component system response regulator